MTNGTDAAPNAHDLDATAAPGAHMAAELASQPETWARAAGG